MKTTVQFDRQLGGALQAGMASKSSTIFKQYLLRELQETIDQLLTIWKTSSLSYYYRRRTSRYPKPSRTGMAMSTDVVSTMSDVSAIGMRVSGFIWVPNEQVPWWGYVNYGRITWQTGNWWEGYHYMEHGMNKIMSIGEETIKKNLTLFIMKNFPHLLTNTIIKQTQR